MILSKFLSLVFLLNIIKYKNNPLDEDDSIRSRLRQVNIFFHVLVKYQFLKVIIYSFILVQYCVLFILVQYCVLFILVQFCVLFILVQYCVLFILVQYCVLFILVQYCVLFIAIGNSLPTSVECFFVT